MRKIWLIILIFIFFVSCQNKTKLSQTLELAGNNRKELEKTLNYYKNVKPDSLKFEAACFLIENMHTQYSFDSPFYDEYKIKLKGLDLTGKESVTDSLIQIYSSDFRRKIYDCQVITSDYLINNIEVAFRVWKEKPWSKNIDFETFCEYILPYKVGNEPIEDWREKAFEEYNERLDSLVSDTTIRGAATMLNILIQKKQFDFSSRLEMAPDLGFAALSENFMGYCKNSSDYVVYCMRALGIPSGLDFVKQWGNRSNSHTWNFVLDETGKTWPFDGYYTNLGVKFIHREYSKKGKVFRTTYRLEKSNDLFYIEDDIPAFFLNRNIKDVSNVYWNNPPIEIEASMTNKQKIAYLCVFNNQDWVPVQWGKLNGNKYVFSDMEHEVVYLPCIYKNGNLVPFSYPVILKKDGEIHTLSIKENAVNQITLYRKYPLNPFQTNAARIVRGTFQGSNNLNFEGAEQLGVIETIPHNQLYSSVITKSNKKYRYIRYKGAIQSYGSMAELKFYSDTKLLKGKVIGARRSEARLANNSPEKVFDNNNLTYYIGPGDSAWVGLDLGKPYKLSKVMFAPRNDDNYIKENSVYELFYQDKIRWVSLGKKRAETTSLKYDNVPENALLWLRNHTEGKEERIFTFKNNEIFWW